LRERVLSSRVVFEGNILTLRVDEVEAADGHRSTREVVEHRGAAAVVCVHDGDVVLVKQYRHPVEDVLLELPAGLIGAEETPEETAARELIEETGLRAEALEHLVSYHASPGFTNHRLHLFYSDTVTSVPAALEPGEVIEIERRPLASVKQLLTSGEIQDAKTLVGLSLLALRL
jgi:ADP-ribose pyrophosphatase